MEKDLQQIQAWLAQDADKRDIGEGAMLIRRCLRNPAFANSLIHYPSRTMAAAEEELKKWATVRAANITHEQVVKMTQQVLQQEKTTVKEHSERMAKGKRADHDRLPEDIQLLYKENLTLMRTMRILHERLLIIYRAGDKRVCRDGDSYPILKELIKSDTKYHKNWKKYDTYQIEEQDAEHTSNDGATDVAES